MQNTASSKAEGQKVVFLDRGTLAEDIQLAPLAASTQWVMHDSTRSDQVVERCRSALALVTNKAVITAAHLEQLPALKYIGVVATGVNVVDLDLCRQRGIVVTNISGYGTDSVAEHTLMMMLMLARQCLPYQRTLQAQQWQRHGQFCYFLGPIRNLRGLQLGLIGTGAIAQRVAQLAAGFGMMVDYHSPSGRAQVAGQKTLALPALLAQSDVVSVHCPLNETTLELIDETALNSMKDSAVLINCARGKVVDVQALVCALDEQRIAGAALDVLPDEPPALDDPVFQRACAMDKLILTPHIAWTSQEAMQVLADQLVDKLNRFLTGLPLENLAKACPD